MRIGKCSLILGPIRLIAPSAAFRSAVVLSRKILTLSQGTHGKPIRDYGRRTVTARAPMTVMEMRAGVGARSPASSFFRCGFFASSF